MKPPLLSIVIPCYQASAHLRSLPEQIDLTSQRSIDNVQFIIVDDNSTDGTDNELTHLLSLRPDLLLLKAFDRVGPGMARNIGLEHATGEYVAFLDVDDRFELNSYIDLAQSMRSAHAEVGAGNYQIIDLKPPAGVDPLRREIGSNCREIVDLLNHHAAVWRYVFSRIWLQQKDLKFPPLMLGEDFLFVLEASSHSPSTIFTKDMMCIYFVGQPGQATSRVISNSHRPELLSEISRRAASPGTSKKEKKLLALWFVRVWGVGFRDSDSKGKIQSIRQLSLWNRAGNTRTSLLNGLLIIIRTRQV